MADLIYDMDVGLDVASGLISQAEAATQYIGSPPVIPPASYVSTYANEWEAPPRSTALTTAGFDLGKAVQALPVAKQTIPAIAAAAGISLPAWLTALLGVGAAAGAGYGILQGLGLGEGEGLFGLDILGGPAGDVSGIPLVGPGAAEPPASITLRHWKTVTDRGDVHYYLVVKPGTKQKWIVCYNTYKNTYKAWRLPKPHLAVIGKNMPRHQMLTRLRRNLSRHSADARTILKVTSPRSLRQTTYRRRRR